MGLTPEQAAAMVAWLTANNGQNLWNMAYADGRRDPSFTLNVDFAAYVVPEPSTLSLLVVGVLLLGTAAWRREFIAAVVRRRR
jgi:hypothetical protein